MRPTNAGSIPSHLATQDLGILEKGICDSFPLVLESQMLNFPFPHKHHRLHLPLITQKLFPHFFPLGVAFELLPPAYVV